MKIQAKLWVCVLSWMMYGHAMAIQEIKIGYNDLHNPIHLAQSQNNQTILTVTNVPSQTITCSTTSKKENVLLSTLYYNSYIEPITENRFVLKVKQENKFDVVIHHKTPQTSTLDCK